LWLPKNETKCWRKENKKGLKFEKRQICKS